MRNRYGATLVHDMSMILSLDEQDVRGMEEVPKWFVTHGGNVDMKDCGGITARTLAKASAKLFTSYRIFFILEKYRARERYATRFMERRIRRSFCNVADG